MGSIEISGGGDLLALARSRARQSSGVSAIRPKSGGSGSGRAWYHLVKIGWLFGYEVVVRHGET